MKYLDVIVAAGTLLAVLAACSMLSGCCSMSPLERKTLTIHQDQHPHMWKHPMPWEDDSWETCPLRHTFMCCVTGIPLVLTVTILDRPYWEEQIRFWKQRHKYHCPDGDDCECDVLIGELTNE